MADDPMTLELAGASDARIAGVVLRRCRAWVACEIGRTVGFLALDGDEVDQLYLLLGQHRRGVGSRLLAVAKRKSRSVWAFTPSSTTCARVFYEAHGFRAVAFDNGTRNEEREPDVRYEWLEWVA